VAQKISFLLAFLAGGMAITAPVVRAQSLLPYVPQQEQSDFKREAERLYKSSLSLAQFQLYDQAIPRALLASQLAPERSDVLLLLGTLYLQNQKTDKSIEILQKAQALNSKDANILLALGTALFQKGDYPNSIQKLQAGLKLNPTSVSGMFDLGNAYYRTKRYPEAIDTYRRAVKQKADFWPALNNIGLISYETGNPAVAIQSWQQSIGIDKKAAEPQLALAVALFQQGKQEEAYRLGEAALRNDSRYASMDYLKENLWGEKLLTDTSNFLKTPRIRAALTLGTGTSGNP
jgi:tetratricopeptide (TPR) repeat protein